HDAVARPVEGPPACERGVEQGESPVEPGEGASEPVAMEDRRRDHVRHRMKTPAPQGCEPRRTEHRLELRKREQAEPPVPRVVAQDARARRARRLPPRGGRRHAVAERVEREAREERPREVEAPAVLALDEQAPARTQHPAELAERAGGRVDEGERAAAAGGDVEAPVRIRELLYASEREGRGRQLGERRVWASSGGDE